MEAPVGNEAVAMDEEEMSSGNKQRSPPLKHTHTDAETRDKPLSPTLSDTNSCVSNESSFDNNIIIITNNDDDDDDDDDLDTHIHTHTHTHTHINITTTTNIHENQQEQEYLQDHLRLQQHQGTPAFSVHQNGSNGVYSLPESNGGYEEIDVAPNTSTSSRSPNTAIGRGYLESLLDDNSNNVIPTTSFNSENEILSHNEELEPQVEEYDVERVIQKQETHDLYCPNCHSCITKRVILRRRKRKIHEISTASGTALDQSSGLPAFSDDIAEETQQSQQVGGAPDSRLDAISCFSCFSIFVPSGEGFLCWRFKPKADATRQPVVTSTGHGQAEESTTDDSTGTVFPLWVVTCCQPAERKKLDETTATPGSIYVPIPEDDTEAVSREAEPPLPLSDDIPVSSKTETLVPEHSTGRPYTSGLQQGVGSTSKNKTFNPIKPYGDTLSSETPSNITTEEGSNFPLWILTCCQPSMVGKKMNYPVKLGKSEPAPENPPALSGGTNLDHPVKPGGTAAQRKTPLPPSDSTEFDHLAKPDGTVPQRDTLTAPSDFTKFGHLEKSDGIVPQKETPSAPSDFTQSYHAAKPDGTLIQRETLSAPSGGTRPPLAPSDDIPVPPFRPTLPAIYIPGTSPQSKPITPVEPNDGIPLPPQTESSTSLGVLSIPPEPQLPVMPSNTHGAELLVDVEPGVARGTRRPGVSGLDVIKAIVYGGLLESITSLSVITAAAGGEATTLNIVALGLANVLGGLVVLVHSLRVLKHEHTTEHYEAQLGRPGHYMFHAAVAILSYLVFGLMSPVIYGFSFRKSDNKDYKLATLAGVALACITILSVGKAYVRNPPKGYIKTVFYYICLGFMVSGLGYVAGDVINTLLKKFGIFDPRAPDNVGGLAAGVMNGGWSSY